MSLSIVFKHLFKWLLILSSLMLLYSWVQKDELPEPEYYSKTDFLPPVQLPTTKKQFSTNVNGQTYIIKPEFEYELQGVVVSYHNADVMSDIWHHDKWKDFINIRDLCVIWGDNIKSGVYKKMAFSNDSWTCWASWPDQATGELFSMRQLSNNHLLSDNEKINRVLMSAEPGDHIKLTGVLAEYSNPGNGFNRGTSTIREDTGNGACETIYLNDFEIIDKANAGYRGMYVFSLWMFIISLAGFLVAFLVSPFRG